MFLSALATVILVPLVVCQTDPLDQECHILQTLEDLQNRLTTAETQITQQSAKIDQQSTDIAVLQYSLTAAHDEIENQDTEITTLKSSLTTADNKIDQQATEITTLRDTLTTTETDIAELQTSLAESSRTPNVLFHVRDVSPQPTANNVIHFQTVIENVGDGYNVSSGCFTAPIGGTYWFSAQLCPYTDRLIIPSLYIRDSLSSRVHMRDADYGDCGSVTAVATLEVNDTVCLRSSPGQHTDPVYTNLYHNTNSFMGAILN